MKRGDDAFGRLVSTSVDGEPTVEHAYDAFGTRTATTRRTGSADAEWRKSESTSGFALVDSDVWSVQTNVTSCSDAAIAPIVMSRAVQLTGLTSANPARTRTTDVRGNVTEGWTEFASGVTTSKRRVPEATSIISSRSRYGVELETVSLSAVTNTTVYDSLGRVSTSIDGRGNATRTEYDACGRMSATIDPVGARTSYAYDAFGNVTSVTDPLGNATVYEYDLRGRKAYEGGAAYPVRYTYDVHGNRTSMTTYRDESLGPGSGDTTRWLYDGASNCMTSKVYADGKGPAYDYDANGRMTKRTWARGIATSYAYDGWGSLTNTTYSDDTPSVVLAYDAMGRQTRAVDAAGVTTFAYDSFGSLTNETVVGVAGTNTIERFSDAFGRDAGYALNGVRQSTLAYDPTTGRLATMLAAGSETPFAWTYLPGSDFKSSLAYPNGLTASWTYGSRGELLEVDNALPGGSVSKYVYTYDMAGRRIACAKSGSAFTTPDSYAYLYNARSELTNATASVDVACSYGYQFDDIGNRETSSERGTNSVYTANSLNQYTAVDDFAPQFDDDGNQTLVKTATGIWQVTYNGENRPVRWVNGETVITMSYDRMGRRVAKDGQYFVYEGYLQIVDNNANSYIWDCTENVVTRPLAWIHDGETLFYTHDGNKNVSEVIDFVFDGSLVAHYDYSPFGAVVAQRGVSATVNPWRFSSEFSDGVCGMTYYNLRHFNFLNGRWMSRDVIGVFGGANLYGFVFNDPYNRIDVKGAQGVLLPGVAIGVFFLDLWNGRRCRSAGGEFEHGKCCCGGTSLDYKVNCCRNKAQHPKGGEVVARVIKQRMGEQLMGGFNSFPMHYWLEWDNKRVEANRENDTRGKVVYTVGVRPAQLGFDLAKPYDWQRVLPELDREIRVSACAGEDALKFRECLSSTAFEQNGTYSNKLCHEYIDDLVRLCRERSRR